MSRVADRIAGPPNFRGTSGARKLGSCGKSRASSLRRRVRRRRARFGRRRRRSLKMGLDRGHRRGRARHEGSAERVRSLYVPEIRWSDADHRSLEAAGPLGSGLSEARLSRPRMSRSSRLSRARGTRRRGRIGAGRSHPEQGRLDVAARQMGRGETNHRPFQLRIRRNGRARGGVLARFSDLFAQVVHAGRSDADHRPLEGCGCLHGGGGRIGSSARGRGHGRLHHHRALESRGGLSRLQFKPTLRAARRAVFVLAPTIRTKHAVRWSFRALNC